MSQTMWMRTALIGVLVIGVSACGADDGAPETDGEDTSTSSGASGDETTATSLAPPPKAPDVDLGSIPDWFVNEDAAPNTLVATIAEALDADYIGSMAVEWPTGGLGCSSGGYDLQVITPGYVIFYDGGDTLIRVHTSESGNWKQCELGRPLEGTPVLTS